MDKTAFYKLTYGLFILTAKDEEKDNGCLINTAIQAAFTPPQISICVNKANFTHDMIMKTGEFTVSVLSEDADYDLYKHFGFKTGKDIDKFADFKDCKRGANGIYYITKGTNAFISVKVDKTVNLGSHTMFIGMITDMASLNERPSATYDYYLKRVKPQPPISNKPEEDRIIWRCRICGYEYEGENIPEDFICPVCKHPASDFEKVTYMG